MGVNAAAVFIVVMGMVDAVGGVYCVCYDMTVLYKRVWWSRREDVVM